MEDQLPPQEELPKRKSNKWLWISLLLIFATFFIAGDISLWIYTKKTNRIHKYAKNIHTVPISNMLPSRSISISPTREIPNKYVTANTQIATSLEAPPLYPTVKWTETVASPQTESLNQAAFVDTGLLLPFSKGRYWETVIPQESKSTLFSYYQNELEKISWISDGESLQFSTFTINAISGDRPCAGVHSYVGYKDGMVKLLSVGYSSQPCILPELSSVPSHVSEHITIFISEPKPIDEFIIYIMTHTKK